MSVARLASIVATGALLVSACAGPAPTPVVSSDLVVVGTSSGVAAFDWAAGQRVYHAPGAVATPDWSRLVASSPEGGTPGVLDGQTGASVGRLDVPGGLTASALSTDGYRVALADASQPARRETTRIVVADPAGGVPARTFDLAGNYESDAFSVDDQRLLVLDYQPPLAPDRYEVKQLDLRTGALSGVGSRLKEVGPLEPMRGTRRMRVLSPDHHTLYSLYTQQPDLHSPDALIPTPSSGDGYAYVHVLSLSDGWAYCLDLPRPFGVGPAAAHTLALSADGSMLYAADRSSGSVARVDTTQLIVRATASLGSDPAAVDRLAAARVGPDGNLFIGGGSDVVVVEPKTLAVVRRLHVPGPTRGLGLSADGQRLFVGIGDSVVALDPVTGAELGRVLVPGIERIEHVGTARPASGG